MKQRKSILNDYYYAALVTGICLILMSVIFSIFIYNQKRKYLYDELGKSADAIEKKLNDSFNFSANLAKLIGRKIIEQNNLSYQEIASILNGELFTNPAVKEVFSYTIYDWIDNNKKIVVSGPFGILKEPKDLSFRNYVKLALEEPWVLHFDQPDYGIPSKQFIIPAGMGITNNRNELVGIVSLGFGISNLIKSLNQEIEEKNIEYSIFFNDNKTFLQSDKYAQFTPEDIANILTNNKPRTGFLDHLIEKNNLTFVYYKHFNKYPFTIIVGYNNKILKEEISIILLPRIVEFFILGFIFLAFLLATRKKIFTPLITLSNIVSSISQGNFPKKIPKFVSSEKNVLARQLNKILLYVNKLISLNSGLEKKVLERTKELELALAAKTEFLNNMSHEIRTPIQGFMGISEGLDYHWDKYNDQAKHRFVSDIAKNAKRLASLLGNLLDLAKFNQGIMILDLSKFSFNQVVEDIIDESKVLYVMNKKLELNFIPLNGLIEITADKERISQVLRNLFVNSIKFSKEDGVINCEMSLVNYTTENGKNIAASHFKITDQGIGIPKDELDSIFLPFVQSSRSKTKAGGTGLGLSICKQIISSHGGKIWAENNPNGGANFNFIIPLVNN